MSRGIDKERQVRKRLEAEGWWVARCAGSFGDADLVALKAEFDVDGWRVCYARLIEVKSSGYPFAHFGPKDRQELLDAADLAGAQAVLAHWPARGKLTFLYPESWPPIQEKAAA